MHNLISTGPYPPGQVDPAECCEPDERSARSGLGLLPLALIAAGQETGAFDVVGDFFGNVFGGDTPDHDMDKVTRWAAAIGAGQTPPCAGPFDLAEVRAAVAAAPRGSPGDDPGTLEGLRTALVQPMPELAPYVRSTDTLARVAVGVAHGRLDCKVGWQEEPAVAHLAELVRAYRARPAPAFPSLFGGGDGGPALASIVPSGGAGTLALLGLAGAAVYLFTRR